MVDAVPSIVVRTSGGPSPSTLWSEALVSALNGAVRAGALDGWVIDPPDGTPEPKLVLILESGTVVLTSTLTRMLAAVSAGHNAVRARTLPRGNVGVCVLLASGTEPSTAQEWPSAVVFADRVLDEPTEEIESVSGESLLEQALTAARLKPARGAVAMALAADSPMLSVVMRTQLARPEALRDALLCLAGQTDERFELILVAHDIGIEGVSAILADQPDSLTSRTKVLTASGGGRSHPLNVGIHAASGSHVAFLDDDDLVMSHWVESFLASAQTNPRSLLRCRAGVQRVTPEDWPGGVRGHSTRPSIERPYPKVFNLADHLRVNMTPFMAFAFPRGFFVVFGGADESLDVCEDWDLALRAASIIGVLDVPQFTAVYRRWTSGQDSYSTHEPAAWDASMRRVREKLDRVALILPPGSASELAELSTARVLAGELEGVYASRSWRVTSGLRWVTSRFSSIRRGS